MDNSRIFGFLAEKLAIGKPCVLVTVLSVEGSSMRDPGAHMGVCEDGEFAGSLSGGCIETAVVAEAQEAVTAGAARVTRFGSGSKYLDIKLPCGGGLDIHFQPLFDAAFIEKCRDAAIRRTPFSLKLYSENTQPEFSGKWRETCWQAQENIAVIGHWPAPRILGIGHGAALGSLASQAQAMGLEVSILTPDESLAEGLMQAGMEAGVLQTTRDVNEIKSDLWTATVFMFHDHDWEGYLLAHALSQPHFYLGAMGGRKAHEFRTGILQEMGVTRDRIDGIHAPIGLFHSARDPDTLAISALAQVIKTYQNYDFAGAYG